MINNDAEIGKMHWVDWVVRENYRHSMAKLLGWTMEEKRNYWAAVGDYSTPYKKPNN